MAQNITLLGATYQNVPAVSLPKSGGGSALFTDTSDATATEADLAVGTTAYVRGVLLHGTGRGGTSTRFNVLDYGATGDGFTDDTAAMQAAFDAAAEDGGTVYIPGGTYHITSTLSVLTSKELAVVGDSSGVSCIWNDSLDFALSISGNGLVYRGTMERFAIISYEGSCGGIALNNQAQFTMSDVSVYNSSPRASGVGIYMENCSQCMLTDVQVQGYGTGISIDGGSTYGDIYLTSCRFDGNNSTAVEVTDAEGIFATNVTCYGNAQALGLSGSKNSLFSNCVFDSSAVYNAEATQCERLKFTGCWFSDTITNRGSGSYDNVHLSYVNKSEFTGCSFIRGAKHGLYAEGCSGLTVTGCRFEDNDWLGTYQPGLRFAYSDHCMATGCQFVKPEGKQVIGLGLYQADWVTIVGNDISTATVGIDGSAAHSCVGMNMLPSGGQYLPDELNGNEVSY